MTTNHDHDFHQLRGSFDRPVQPRTTFADALRRELQQANQAPLPRIATPTPVVAPRRIVPARTAPPPHREHQQPAWMSIAAALLVFVLIGAGWWTLGHQQPAPPETELTRYAAMPGASPTTAATEQLTDGETLTATRLGLIPADEYIIAQSDAMIITTSSPDHRIAAYNPTTGEKIWHVDGYAGWDATIHDDVIYLTVQPSSADTPATPGVTANGQDSVPTAAAISLNVSPPTLGAIDLQTGKLLWTAVGSWPSFTTEEQQRGIGWTAPIAADDTVLLADSRGNMIGFNAATGVERWQSQLFPEGWDNGWTLPPLAAIGDRFYTVYPPNGLVSIDSQTGSVSEPTQLRRDNYSLFGSSLYNVDGNLLIMSPGGMDGSSGPATTIQLLNPNSGDVYWERVSEGATGELRIANGKIAFRSEAVQSAPFPLSLIPRFGDDRALTTVTVLDATTGDELSFRQTELSTNWIVADVAFDGQVVCTILAEPQCQDLQGNTVKIDGLPPSTASYPSGEAPKAYGIRIVDGAVYLTAESGIYVADLTP